jgi:NADPH:quinone reductase-like Zn-dependent oxidoreductase
LKIARSWNQSIDQLPKPETPNGPPGRAAGPPDQDGVPAPAVNQTMVFFLAQQNTADLAVLSELLQAGKVTPVIDRTYALNKTAEAIRYLEQGHAKGKVV